MFQYDTNASLHFSELLTSVSHTNFKWYMKIFTDQTQDKKKNRKSKYWDSYRKFSGGYCNSPGTLPKQSWGNELQLIILKVNKISWIHHGFQQPSLLYSGTHDNEVSIHSCNYNAHICILFPKGMHTCQSNWQNKSCCGTGCCMTESSEIWLALNTSQSSICPMHHIARGSTLVLFSVTLKSADNRLFYWLQISRSLNSEPSKYNQYKMSPNVSRGLFMNVPFQFYIYSRPMWCHHYSTAWL